MKSHGAINGSSAGLAAVFHLENSVGFLANRQRVIHLVPISPDANAGYVWRRVFLRARDAL
ncbi:MAG: hypothetical protein HY748_09905 [Elusimicrobia bacterium]|nr:hypothetical protein [Elusimicrobiota bacterium]